MCFFTFILYTCLGTSKGMSITLIGKSQHSLEYLLATRMAVNNRGNIGKDYLLRMGNGLSLGVFDAKMLSLVIEKLSIWNKWISTGPHNRRMMRNAVLDGYFIPRGN